MKWSVIDYAALFLFTFVTTVTIMTFIYPPATRLDFSIYLVVTQLVAEHKTIYPLFIGGVLFPYTHPPSLVPFFLAFLSLPPDIGASLWNIISLLSIYSALTLMIKVSSVSMKFYSLLLILSAGVLLEPVRETFLFGQNNTVVLLFLALCFFFSQKKSHRQQLISGIFLGVAAALKLFPLLLLFYFLIKKQWLCLIAAIATFVIFLYSGSFGSIEYIRQYIHYAQGAITPIHAVTSDESLSSFILYFFPALQKIQTSITTVLYGLFILSTFYIWKKASKSGLHDFLFFSQLIAGTILIITPLAWMHHLVFLIPLCVSLLLTALSSQKKKDICIFIIFFVLCFLPGEDIVLALQSFHLPLVSLIYFHALLALLLLLIVQLLVASSQISREH